MEGAALARTQATPAWHHYYTLQRTQKWFDQQRFLARGAWRSDRIIGYSGDTEDLDYLRAVLDNGSTLNMDRFGMEHVLADDRRVRTVLALLRLGYADD